MFLSIADGVQAVYQDIWKSLEQLYNTYYHPGWLLYMYMKNIMNKQTIY